MKNKLLEIWSILSKRRRQLVFNLFFMITSGISEMICLALLTPLLNNLISEELKTEILFLILLLLMI